MVLSYYIDDLWICQYIYYMTLDEVLKILGKEEATRVAGCGRSASWHWFQSGSKRKVPNVATLVLWGDHLELPDADLGELIRDSHRIRMSIFALLGQNDKKRINKRSVLRRSLAKEIIEEIEEMRQKDLKEKKRLALAKEKALEKEYRELTAESERQGRLEQIREQLKTLRSDDYGDY